MELNWTTFALEIVNFLVLVWILKRFLYKPVLAAIARRKAAIDETLANATARQAEAHALEQQFRNRLADWESEKENLRAVVLEENNVLRRQLTASLQDALAKEREKARALDERRLIAIARRTAEESIAQGVQFTTRLLTRTASPELEAKLLDLVVEDLPNLPKEPLDTIRAACPEHGCLIKVTTAYPLSEQRRGAITDTLRAVARPRASVEFNEDQRLLAGVRIDLGSWMLRANLQDELEFFAEAVSHDQLGQ